jgi:riboflavin kinase, archaea type
MDKLSPVLMSELYELVKLKAHQRFVNVSSEELASKMGQSQQASSQHLQKLEKLGLIERRRAGLRFAIRLTPKGYDIVRSHYSQLKAAVEEKGRDILFKGRVFRGFGEAAYYISNEGYRRQFVKILGFDPFPGTLNLKLESPIQMEQKRELRSHEGLKIQGFENGTRTYGGARCYRAVVNGKVPAAVLVIERTHYDDSVLEIISQANFRKDLGLEDGDEVTVAVSA